MERKKLRVIKIENWNLEISHRVFNIINQNKIII